jgi:hypothetical protein
MEVDMVAGKIVGKFQPNESWKQWQIVPGATRAFVEKKIP